MAKINQTMLDRICAKLSVGKARAYTRIQETAVANRLDRHLAALLLAWENGISIQKYSTPEERAQLKVLSPPIPAAQPATVAVSKGGARKSAKSRRPSDNSVFVIHGRDVKLRDSLYAFLSALGLKPVEFHQAVAKARTGNPYVGDVLDKAFDQVQALVILLSPDDEARLKNQFVGTEEANTEGRYRGQARANVLFEAGMALARHEEKTIMVQVGDIKPFSDVFGRHIIRLDDSFEKRNDLALRLSRVCKVDTTGTRWTKIGTFAPTKPK